MASCVIVGEGTLPVLCAQAYARDGVIRATCSPDSPLQKWSEANQIPHFARLAEFQTYAGDLSFDYLFSIVNYRILSPEILALPAKMAINYHDGPLPRYAGLYVTTWALMNREPSHGITWHVMVPQVDGGDILKQEFFPIEANDTAYRLNLKCYYSAVAAFSELVAELMAGSETRTPQDLTQRTYYGASYRPPNDGLVSFAWPAEKIDAFVRALDFEETRNPIGVPKVAAGGRIFALKQVNMTEHRSTLTPGTIVSLDPVIRVATATNDITFESLWTLEGRMVSLDEFRGVGLAEGISIQASNIS